MFPWLRRYAGLAFCWSSALVLAFTPIVIAADFGGVLWWTQYVASFAFLIAIILVIPYAVSADCTIQKRSLILLVPLVLWSSYAWFQLVPLNAPLVEHLSPGAYEARTNLVRPFFSTESRSSEGFPLSLSVDYSRHAASMLLVLTGLAWASAIVFTTRNRIGLLLGVIAVGASLHAAFGLYTLVFPQTEVFGTHPGASRFGCFVNRNNAALLLNIGVASGLGLLAWRHLALTGQEVDDPEFEVNDLIALVSDRDSAIGVCSLVLCMSGLLVCGSRGALVAAIGGFLLAFGWVRQRRGLKTVPVLLVAILMAAALLLVPLSLDLESVKRFAQFPTMDASTLSSDGRLNHWRDGMTAARAYLPAGSGLGTYAYAYLPYQQYSSFKWYHHADNLWLELLVEQGVVGVLLAGAILVIWIGSLVKLADAANPIDQGLRVTGWYMIGVVLLSQCFDFGLIVPANLFLITILTATVVSRGMGLSGGGKISFPSLRSRFTWYGLVALAVSLAVLGVGLLERDAGNETSVRKARVMVPYACADAEALAELENELINQIECWPSATLYDALSDIRYRMARLQEVVKLAPTSADEAIEAYKSTGVRARRKRSLERDKAGLPREDQVPAYREALESSQRSLHRLPLGMESRLWQVYLDFVHQDAARTREALVQLTRFYRNNARMLVRLGRFAADSNENALAISAWRSALTADPGLTRDVIESVMQQEAIELSEVLPEDPSVYRRVADYLVAKPTSDRKLASLSLERLSCEACNSKKERAGCLRRAGDLAFTVGYDDQAFDYYRAAIEFLPTDADLRLHVIERLHSRGRLDQARRFARRGRSIFPENDRFQMLIEEIADEEIQDANHLE